MIMFHNPGINASIEMFMVVSMGECLVAFELVPLLCSSKKKNDEIPIIFMNFSYGDLTFRRKNH